MQNFKFIGATVSEIRVFQKKKKMKKESENHVLRIISYNFLHAVTF